MFASRECIPFADELAYFRGQRLAQCSPFLSGGELREIRRLLPEIESIKEPLRLKTGDEERTFQTLVALAQAVIEHGQKGIEVQRYKGLGEMNPSQLWDTTMNPEARSLLKIQIGSMEQAEEMFSKLMGDQVEPRRKFIEENALDVKNLDI